MKFENTEVWGFEHALRGMRNPLNSWDRSDSHKCNSEDCAMVENGDEPGKECDNGNFGFCIGENDMKLAQRLIRAGSEHRKYMRQIFVSVDITAPLYWIHEMDTYRIGTTRNSCSFQHKGTSKPFEIGDFSLDYCETQTEHSLNILIDELNRLRELYLETKDYNYFRRIRQLLPSGYNYKFTWTGSYENILNMVHQRKNHKLTEWSEDFISWAKTLPYAEELLFLDEE